MRNLPFKFLVIRTGNKLHYRLVYDNESEPIDLFGAKIRRIYCPAICNDFHIEIFLRGTLTHHNHRVESIPLEEIEYLNRANKLITEHYGEVAI